MGRDRRTRAERGFLLITVYLLLPVLFSLIVATSGQVLADLRATQRQYSATQALYLAEAGVDQALVALRANQNWTDGYWAVPLGTTGTYTVTVSPLGNNRMRLTAEGQSTVAQMPVSRSIDAIAQINPLFRYAMFGRRSVGISANNFWADGFDSAQTGGPWHPYSQEQAWWPYDWDAATNSTQNGSIRVEHGDVIYGNLIAGPEANLDEAIHLHGWISGHKRTARAPLALPPVVIPPGVVNSGPLHVTRPRSLPGGTYWFDMINIAGHGELTFTGPATVYVTGNVHIGGRGIVTAGQRARNLLLYVQGSHTIDFPAPNPDVHPFYGAIYAPDANVILHDGFNGAAIGDTMHVNSVKDSDPAKFHYDIDLRQANLPYTVELLSWSTS